MKTRFKICRISEAHSSRENSLRIIILNYNEFHSNNLSNTQELKRLEYSWIAIYILKEIDKMSGQ